MKYILRSMEPVLIRVPVVMVLAITLSGCTRQPLFMREQAADELLSAEKALTDGQYALARMKFMMVLEDHPESETARFGLGVSHFRLGAYDNADRHFARYLDNFPKGMYAAESVYYLSEIEKIRLARQKELERQVEKRLEQAVAAQSAVKADPDNPRLRVELGNAYWNMDRYEDAAAEYVKAVELDGRYRADADVRSRVEFGPGGRVVVLTPRELDRRDREENPVVLTNDNGYRAGRNPFDFQYSWYIVSGQVRKRSTRRVRGVAVDVTVFDLSGQVLDARRRMWCWARLLAFPPVLSSIPMSAESADAWG